MPVRVRFGEGVRRELPFVPPVEAAKRITLLIGGSSLKKSGHLDALLKLLLGKHVDIVDGIAAEPTLDDLARAVTAVRKQDSECLVAVGGGSVLDVGKAAAFLAPQTGDVHDLLSNIPAHPLPPLPFVCLPTTSGTGSEVTPFAVFWDKAAKKKLSLSHHCTFPNDALVDPELTYTVPPAVTASAGMDAFTQACEAYWNKDANPVSDDYALAAIARILLALPRAVADGGDRVARYDMALGSLQGGLAFSNTRTAACHSISYPMTSRFGVPHGQAVGITLPAVLLLNATVQPERVARFCRALDVRTMEEASDKIRHMMEQSGLQTTLSGLGIAKADIETIVREGFAPERMGNNPYVFTADTLRTMLLTLL